jgi:hypothetical protein
VGGGEKRNAYRTSMGKPEGRTSCRWEVKIKSDLREIGWGGMHWTDLVQDCD